jgi:hypothetical protein
MSPRPSYLRPARVPQIFDPDPAGGDQGGALPQIFDPNRPSAATDALGDGPGPRPRLRLTDPSTLHPVEDAPAPSASPSLRDRLGTVLEQAGRTGNFDPNSSSGLEAGIGSFLTGVATRRTFERQMSQQQQTQQDKAVERKSQQDLRAAQAEYYRGRAHAAPTGMTQADRLELEKVRQGNMLERIRTAADLRRRQLSHGNEGKLSQSDRYVLGRTERADMGANRAVESERTQAERGYRDPVTEAEDQSIRARLRRSIDPNYVADSTAVANRINPQLGVPAAVPSAGKGDDFLGGFRSILENYLRKQGLKGGNVIQPRPPQTVLPSDTTSSSSAHPEPDQEPDHDADDSTSSSDEQPAEGDDNLSDDEITSALGMIEDLKDEEAQPELMAAGYTDDQITKILAHRKSD